MQTKGLRRAALAGALISALVAVPAQAASSPPITVNLRIEGSAGTLFEGPVATQAEMVTTTTGGTHPCDVADNGSNGGFGTQSGTPTTAVYDAAAQHGWAFDAQWFGSPTNDFFVSQIGSDINGGSPNFPSWGYAVNFTTANVGGCQFQIAPGSDVLWAYDYFNKSHLLKLTGPATANVGSPIVYNVVDGQNGSPISGASLGNATTDSNGNATVSFSATGQPVLKASRADSVRSNGLLVCVHNGNDGTCGTPAPPGVTPTPPPVPLQTPLPAGNGAPPLATVSALRDGMVFPKGHTPRLLHGSVTVTSRGLKQVEFKLQRYYQRRCQYYSSRLGRLLTALCGHGWRVRTGSSPTWSYLLPGQLPPGSYRLDVVAFDAHGAPGKTDSVYFRVTSR